MAKAPKKQKQPKKAKKRRIVEVIPGASDAEGYDDYCWSEDGGATCVPPTSVFQSLANAPPPLSTCANNTCGAYLDASLPTCDDHFGSVDQFATDAFGPLCESTDVYRTSIKVGDGRKKGFQYNVPSSASDDEEACRTVVAAQRAFTVGGGWDVGGWGGMPGDARGCPGITGMKNIAKRRPEHSE